MRRQSRARSCKALTVIQLFCCALAAWGAGDAHQLQIRPYRFGTADLENQKRASLESPLQRMGAPVLNTIAPESVKAGRAMTLPEGRCDVGRCGFEFSQTSLVAQQAFVKGGVFLQLMCSLCLAPPCDEFAAHSTSSAQIAGPSSREHAFTISFTDATYLSGGRFSNDPRVVA